MEGGLTCRFVQESPQLGRILQHQIAPGIILNQVTTLVGLGELVKSGAIEQTQDVLHLEARRLQPSGRQG